jgi:hypothetical protein
MRLEAGYLAHDEVDGLKQTEGYIAPQFILQKNYFDDTLIFDIQRRTGICLGEETS